MTDRNVIGQNIASLRRAQNMTQAELAEKLGVSPQAVSQWERCETLPDILMLPQIAEVLCVKTSIFFGESESLDCSTEVSEDRIDMSEEADYEIVLLKNGKIYKKLFKSKPGELPFNIYLGDIAGNLTSALSIAAAGDIAGSASAGLGLTVNGNVSGNAEAGLGMTVYGSIAGNAAAGMGISYVSDKSRSQNSQRDVTVRADIDDDLTTAANITIYGNINGDVDCADLTVNGTIEGDADCSELAIDGNIEGDVDCESLTVKSGNIGGDVDCASIEINGNIEGDVDCEALTLKGKVEGEFRRNGNVIYNDSCPDESKIEKLADSLYMQIPPGTVISTSYIQRVLQCSYGEAVDLISFLCDNGFVEPTDNRHFVLLER